MNHETILHYITNAGGKYPKTILACVAPAIHARSEPLSVQEALRQLKRNRPDYFFPDARAQQQEWV